MYVCMYVCMFVYKNVRYMVSSGLQILSNLFLVNVDPSSTLNDYKQYWVERKLHTVCVSGGERRSFPFHTNLTN